MSTLHVEGIEKHFGGVEVLRNVTLAAESGRVTAIIGPNGAGKSTLANIISGLVSPDRGQVLLDGTDITRLRAHRRARMGIARTFQSLQLFSGMTVRENVALGAFRHRRRNTSSNGASHIAVGDVITALQLTALAEREVDSLGFAQAKLVEPGRILAMQPSVLVMDEPAAGLGEDAVHSLGPWIAARAAAGVAVLIIEHNMRLVMGIADFIYVLDHGVLIAQGKPAAIRTNPLVLEAYLGHEAAESPA